jgi:hypothetical protein
LGSEKIKEVMAPSVSSRRYWLSNFKAIPANVERAIMTRQGVDSIMNLFVQVMAYVPNVSIWKGLTAPQTESCIIRDHAEFGRDDEGLSFVARSVLVCHLEFLKGLEGIRGLSFPETLYSSDQLNSSQP